MSSYTTSKPSSTSTTRCSTKTASPALPTRHFFAKGVCKAGTSCRFLHVRDETDSSREICQFFAKTGSCKWAENCRHRHVRNASSPKQQQQQQQKVSKAPKKTDNPAAPIPTILITSPPPTPTSTRPSPIPATMTEPEWADWLDDAEDPDTLRLIWAIRNGKGPRTAWQKTRATRGDEIVVPGVEETSPLLVGERLDQRLRGFGAHPRE